MSDLSAAHAHNALTSAVQMYGAILTAQQRDIEVLKATVALKEAAVVAARETYKTLDAENDRLCKQCDELASANGALLEEIHANNREMQIQLSEIARLKAVQEQTADAPVVPESRLSDRGECHPECQSPSCPGCAIPTP